MNADIEKIIVVNNIPEKGLGLFLNSQMTNYQ